LGAGKHVGAAVEAAAGVVGLAEHAAEPQLAGQLGVGRVGHVVLTTVFRASQWSLLGLADSLRRPF
jgi:hypothetical protein